MVLITIFTPLFFVLAVCGIAGAFALLGMILPELHESTQQRGKDKNPSRTEEPKPEGGRLHSPRQSEQGKKVSHTQSRRPEGGMSNMCHLDGLFRMWTPREEK